MNRILRVAPLVLVLAMLFPLTAEGASMASKVEAFFQGREVHEPQFVSPQDGRLLVVWRERVEDGSNLNVTALSGDGEIPAPVRVNDEPDTVGSYPMDELRAAVASGPGARVAVAWGDSRGQVRVAESHNGGGTWGPSRRLEQVDTPAYRSFPALAYDETGTLHAVWVDSRFADGFAEEPADLFYARISAEEIVEHNLTAEQGPSVCGCCRPYLEATGAGSVRAVFRNTTADGYRDVFSLEGSLDKGFSEPRRVGPPLWKLKGCPMSGPMMASSRVYWPDGSSGAKLLRGAAIGSATQTAALAADADDDWRLRLPPRRVEGSGERTLLLVPGRPHGRLASPATDSTQLEVVLDELPIWATSAYLDGTELWLLGAVSGELHLAIRRLDR